MSKSDLAPYIGRVESRVEKNLTSPVWSHLDGRWGELVGRAEAILATYHAGRPAFRHEVQAARELIKLTDAVGARPVIVAGLAMFLLQDQQPHRFRSDDAFATQLVRRLRGLADVNAGTSFDHKSGRVKRVYRELPPRAVAVLSGWIIPVIGAAGLRLAELERRDREADQRREEEFRTAMESLA